jgi:hypothetical protein
MSAQSVLIFFPNGAGRFRHSLLADVDLHLQVDISFMCHWQVRELLYGLS